MLLWITLSTKIVLADRIEVRYIYFWLIDKPVTSTKTEKVLFMADIYGGYVIMKPPEGKI